VEAQEVALASGVGAWPAAKQATDQTQTQEVVTASLVVLDTNILLDLFIFSDPATAALRAALDARELRFLSTAVMREELRRVLDYPQLQPRMAFYGITAAQVLAAFDARATLCEVAPKAVFTCKDVDDQKFIDLAAAHRAQLLSKDKAVLCMARRLKTLGVAVSRSYVPCPL
jgi:putative PIN family toxin of toxin-antitoxin system